MQKPVEGNVIDIVVIGGSGSGKTVLMVGLYSSSTRKLDVDVKVGRDYLEMQKNALASGHWPGGSQMKSPEDLKIIIKRGGKSVDVSFKDYMGERFLPQKGQDDNFLSYLEKEVRNPSGALILLNPTMKILQSGADDEEEAENVCARNKMLGRIKDVIRYLSNEKRRCRYVVLVTTASDALEKISKEDRERFIEYREQVENVLRNNERFANNWWPCEVTVTGALENLEHPTLTSAKENTAWKPFVSIIDRFESETRHRRIFGKLKTTFFTATIIGLVGAVSVGGWFYWFDREPEREIGKLIASSGVALEKAIKDVKLTEINMQCGALGKGLERFEGKKPFFNVNRVHLAKQVEEARRRIEDGRLFWYPREIDRFEKEMSEIEAVEGLTVGNYGNQLDRVRDFDKKVKAFKVVTPDYTNCLSSVLEKWQASQTRIIDTLESACCAGYKARVKSEEESVGKLLEEKDKVIECDPRIEAWKSIAGEYANLDMGSAGRAKLDALMREAETVKSKLFVRIDDHNAGVLKRRFATFEAEAPDKASEEVCETWRKELEAWKPSSSEGVALLKNMLDDFDRKKECWRKAYENRQYANGVSSLLLRLEKSHRNLDDGTELKAVLIECGKFKKYAEYESSLRLVDFPARKSSWEKIKTERGMLLDELRQSTIKRINSDGDEIPAVSGDDLKFLDEVLKDGAVLSKEEYGAWMDTLNRTVAEIRKTWEAKQNVACDEFVVQVEGSNDACGTVRKFATFYSDHPNAPKIKDVAEKVDAIAMTSFREIVKETVGYRSEELPVFDAAAMIARKKRMNETLGRLRELARATVKVKPLKDLSSGRFAEGCRSVGNIDGGVVAAFRHRYEITHVDVQINYTKFPFNFKCLKIASAILSLEESSCSFVSRNIGECTELTREDNGQWRTVWKGLATADGSPWLDVLFSMVLTDVNTTLWTKDKSNEWRWNLATCYDSGQSYIETECELVTGRWASTGDTKPKINVRIYVKETGVDFFEYLKRFQ